jgi:hypothetical protein
MRTVRVAAITGVIVFLAAGCGPESRDFKREAERLIESDNATRLPMDYKEAACDAPPSLETGATFSCSAVGSDGANYTFETKITGSRKFVVTLNGAG